MHLGNYKNPNNYKYLHTLKLQITVYFNILNKS